MVVPRLVDTSFHPINQERGHELLEGERKAASGNSRGSNLTPAPAACNTFLIIDVAAHLSLKHSSVAFTEPDYSLVAFTDQLYK